jgi:hypothetical protein
MKKARSIALRAFIVFHSSSFKRSKAVNSSVNNKKRGRTRIPASERSKTDR